MTNILNNKYLRTIALSIPVFALEFFYVGNTDYLPATFIISLLWIHKALNKEENLRSKVNVFKTRNINNNASYA
jgi:hypothetical protein